MVFWMMSNLFKLTKLPYKSYFEQLIADIERYFSKNKNNKQKNKLIELNRVFFFF